MTLTARVMVGEDDETAVDFPEPGFDVEPEILGRAARYLLDENHTVNMEYVYPHIGFDAHAARLHLAALAEEKRRAGEGPEEEHRKAVKKFRITAKAIGLELVAGLILGVLDSPAAARCPCRAHIVGRSAVPYCWARPGNPDARADYGDFVIMAEVSTIRRFTMEDVGRQWKGACGHAVTVTGRPRVYCLMVSRLGLDLRDEKKQAAQHRRQLANLGNAPDLLRTAANEAAQKARQKEAEAGEAPDAEAEEDGDPEAPDVKFLLLHIEDLSEIAHTLHALYCGTRRTARALTKDILGAVLDGLHAKTMERLAAGRTFPRRWASDTFRDLLREKVEKKTGKKKKPAGAGKDAA